VPVNDGLLADTEKPLQFHPPSPIVAVDDPASKTLASVAFGRFQVLPHRRELLADGRPVKLGGRAFDVLMALIEARGKPSSPKTVRCQACGPTQPIYTQV
jgi:DNA-binding response OmpR family regulator